MAKKNATSKSSRPTVVRYTQQTIARAITRATNPALLRKTVKTAPKMEDLSIERRGTVDTTELAATIQIDKETSKLVEGFMQSNEGTGIADLLGCVIAASRMAGRA
jgi:hypothetical protein